MNTYQVIKGVMAFGIVIGGIDFMLNKRYSIGEKFEGGFALAGQMFLSMIGIMSITPVIANVLKPLIVPAFQFFGVDPAVFGMFFGIDLGGYHLAMSLADSPEIGKMVGLFTSSMFGGTLVFTIPVSAGLIDKDKLPIFNRGLLYGIVTVPIGCTIGGLLMGIHASAVIINTIPVIILAIAVVLGFRFCLDKTLKLFGGLGALLSKIGVVGIILGFVSYLTDIPLMTGFIPIEESMAVVSGMIIFMVGCLPIIELITKLLRTPFLIIGRKFGFTIADTSGLLITLASNVPMIASIGKMSDRGIILNATWTVAISGIFGSQISFVLGLEPENVVPFIIGKMVAGIISLFIAFYCTRKESTV